MKKAEAKLLLADQLAAWRQRAYTDFVAMLGDCQHSDVSWTGQSDRVQIMRGGFS